MLYGCSLQDAVPFSPVPDLPVEEKTTCDYATYTRLLQEIADLQRSNRLLKALSGDADKGQKLDREDEESLRTELKISEAKVKDLEALLNGQSDAVDLTLVEEKRQLQHLNVGLSDRVADLQMRESKARSLLQDAKDASELLEFRVLELEEELEKKKNINNKNEDKDDELLPALEQIDSGCNTSSGSAEDIVGKYQDFRVRNCEM